MRVIDDDGRTLDAEFAVEAEAPYLALILESRGGGSASRPSRNPDYSRALAVLLDRLGRLDALLADALVDSRHTRAVGLPEPDRRIIDAPVRLALEPDADALRQRMGAAQAAVGRPGGGAAGGNPTKRIRLRLRVPGYEPGDAARLAGLLAAPPPERASRSGTVATFILAWHPLHFRWEEEGYGEAIRVTAAGRNWREDWTVGVRTGGISPGDRAVLYRQHQQRGLVASGVFTSEVERREHWDGSGRLANYADVAWDVVLDYMDRLPVEVLKAEVPEVKWDRIQGSGISVPAPAAPKLSGLWARHTRQMLFRSPDEPGRIEGQTFPEGALSQVPVNRYERDPRARRECLAHWGFRCAVCGFSFEERYGALGKDYIHVHHLRELSRVPPGYQVHPVNDLRPVCPNCHAMIHRGPGPALTIEQLRQQLLG